MALLKDTVQYIVQPIHDQDIVVLRNAFICGIVAFVLFIVGLKPLLVLLAYLFVMAAVIVAAWLYTLGEEARRNVFERIGEVCRTFVRRCVDEAMDERDTVSGVAVRPSDRPEDDAIVDHRDEFMRELNAVAPKNRND